MNYNTPCDASSLEAGFMLDLDSLPCISRAYMICAVRGVSATVWPKSVS
jgi:hypothetical protein